MTTAQQEVTIKLSQKPESDNTPETYTGNSTGGRIIQVKLTSGPTQDFFKYEHALQAGGTQLFHLMEIWDDNNSSISRIKGGKDVTLVAAYYWKHEVGPGRKPSKALIIGVTTETPKKTTYYVRNCDYPPWYPINGGSQPIQLSGEDLEQKLDDLNCSLNEAVTINLTHEMSWHGNTYCCYKHYGQGKVTVTKKIVSCTNPSHQNSITVKKHSVSKGMKLAGIIFQDNSNRTRKRITSNNGLQFPIPDVKAVHAFYCQKKPVLIFIEGGVSSVRDKWFKKGSANDTWEKVDLPENSPENIEDCSGDFEKLLEELNKAGCGKTDQYVKPEVLTILSSKLERQKKELESSNTGVLAGSSVGSGLGGAGLGALAVWKGPSLLARLITKAL